MVDNGPGFDDQVMPRLFEPYVTTKAKGTGLGLTICRRIVETYGGRIWARNADTGGAVFSFSLPVRASTQHSSG